jgi:hypothetical protein
VLSLTTPPEWSAASIGCDEPCRLRPHGCGLGLRGFAFSGPPCVHLCYGPATRTHPKDEVVNGLQVSRFPSCLPFSYEASDSYPDGTNSRWTQQPFLDAQPDRRRYRIRLSDKVSGFRPREGAGQVHQPDQAELVVQVYIGEA